MDALRIILAIIGVAFIIGMYFFQVEKMSFKKLFYPSSFITIKVWFKRFFSKAKNKKKSQHITRSREQLSNDQITNMSNIFAEKSSAQKNMDSHNTSTNNDVVKTSAPKQEQAVSATSANELLITLIVLPKPDSFFCGSDIVSACKKAGLQLGEFNIFHRYALINDKVLMTPVCSLVNLFEPGYFILDEIDGFTTEGLSLFMQLPGPIDSVDAFKILMDVSEKLSLHLNATICDETRSVVTAQTVAHLREKIENYQFKLQMDSLNSN